MHFKVEKSTVYDVQSKNRSLAMYHKHTYRRFILTQQNIELLALKAFSTNLVSTNQT